MVSKSLDSFIIRTLSQKRQRPRLIAKTFKNIKIKKHSVDVRFPRNLNSKNKAFTSLSDAIEYRNSVYKTEQVIDGLLINLSPMKKDFLIIENKDKERVIQINTRVLSTYNIKPVILNVSEFLDDVDAKKTANIILAEYSNDINRIIDMYNKYRVDWFNNIALVELITLEPCVLSEIKFDYSLWRRCYKQILNGYESSYSS